MAKKKQIATPEQNILTAEDLKRYEAGEMTFQEMHRVEKLLLEQPFYADAAEGLSAIKKDKLSVDKNLTDLKSRLGNRINQTANKHTPVFSIVKIWKPVSIAATLLLVFGGTYYLLDNKQSEADTAIVMKNKADADNLSEPTATAPIAKEDNTKLRKLEESVTKNTAKQKQEFAHANQAQAVVREAAPAVVEETEAAVITQPVTEDKVSELPPPPVASAPVAGAAEKKKEVADRNEAIVESKSLPGGAGRMARAAVTGVVVDEDNEPMKDVTINIKGKADGTRTDEVGKFSLRDGQRGDIVIFNSPIMPQMEIPFNSLPNKIVYSEHNIHLPTKPKVSVSSPNDVVFENAVTDAKPEFGWEAFEVYLKENTKRPPKALQMNIQGRVIVSFVVNEKGELSDFTIAKSLGYGCDEEAIRLIKNGPKWFPATKDEKPVSKSKNVIVRFR
ncbi:energy transducer TonB [Emticicia agri]|uniref:TonB family protein n=1 Tax=Emticicia agri TaxID=2492393 RepID=A0A4Q5LUK5_9BACT|nr:energy transducer TonB [Emticicia agri]RYU93294.1 TonB family protein [Emticicia agri]